jgi:hypothetical protein
VLGTLNQVIRKMSVKSFEDRIREKYEKKLSDAQKKHEDDKQQQEIEFERRLQQQKRKHQEALARKEALLVRIHPDGSPQAHPHSSSSLPLAAGKTNLIIKLNLPT